MPLDMHSETLASPLQQSQPELALCELEPVADPSCESFSPYCLKVRRALQHAKLPFESKVGKMPSDFAHLNPAGQVPVLLVDGEVVADSTRILDRIGLMSDNACTDRHNEARLWEELADGVLSGYLTAARWADEDNWPRLHQQFFASAPWLVRRVVAPNIRNKVIKGLVARDVGLRDAETGAAAVYTENLFVKFRDDLDASTCTRLIADHGLAITRTLDYARNAYFLKSDEGTGLRVFALAQQLLVDPRVSLAHPELVRPRRSRRIDPRQWHLAATEVAGQRIEQHINVEAAWAHSRGLGATIAIIDDGVDVEHEEFAGRIVHGRDVTLRSDDPRPKTRHESHGTACAGVACAAGIQASGVAPEAKIMPIRLASGLGSQAEADAFAWAADHGADIISCSWGPTDGVWFDPNDLRHNHRVVLPDSTRLAIDHAVEQGRGGKGCIICWAAGNGNESVENDGYAAYDRVIAVAACNDRGTRSVYSDFGASVWCCFPSSDFAATRFDHPAPLTPGIWTTDRSGAHGYNPPTEGPIFGDAHGDFTASFGGTSSACPGVAGIAALMLAARPELQWHQIKELLRQSCIPIDEDSGTYVDSHSDWYGYGRPDASRSVELARAFGDSPILQLQLEARVTGQLSGAGDQKVYSVELPSGAEITLDGPEGVDFDLYIRRNSAPTTGEFDQRGWTAAADEALTVSASRAGRHFVLVHSYEGAGEFELRIRQHARAMD